MRIIFQLGLQQQLLNAKRHSQAREEYGSIMKIHLKLYGVFRTAAKASEISFSLTEGKPTVRNILMQLVSQEQYHELKQLLIDKETSDPRPNALIMISGREINTLNALDSEIKEGDEVVLLPIAHGG
jgi:molybdopterin converting factor small subunit